MHIVWISFPRSSWLLRILIIDVSLVTCNICMILVELRLFELVQVMLDDIVNCTQEAVKRLALIPEGFVSLRIDIIQHSCHSVVKVFFVDCS